MMEGYVLIPFHHRHDLLRPLLRHLRDVPVLVVDDGYELSDWEHWHDIHPRLECVRASGSSGFTAAVNVGLQYLCERNIPKVLILNDDAWIHPLSIQEILDSVSEDTMVSPVIESNNTLYFGVTVVSWGRVYANQIPTIEPDALLGACLGMSTNWRFDERFIHGFEDIDLSRRCVAHGGRLIILPHIRCVHQHGATLDPRSSKGLKYATWGHLQLFDSLKRMPIIVGTYWAMVANQQCSFSEKLSMLKGVHQGTVGWFWSAIAARMASSKAGSRSAK